MAKRFTATEKWDKEWWMDLSLKHKVLWQFLCDNCDCAGVWEPNWRLASMMIGEKVKDTDLSVFADRIYVLPNDKILILGFVIFQYGSLSDGCRAHQSIIKVINKHGIGKLVEGHPDYESNGIQRHSDTHSNPIQGIPESLKEKEKEQEKEMESTPNPSCARPDEKFPLGAEAAEAIRGMFGRRASTPWSEKEIAAAKKLVPLNGQVLADICVISKARNSGWQFYRKDPVTLFNNWQGEVDRANDFLRGEESRAPVVPTEKDPVQLTLDQIFRRDPNVLWSPDEEAAYLANQRPIDENDLQKLVRFYSTKDPSVSHWDRPTSLPEFLKRIGHVIDTANSYVPPSAL